MRGVPVLKFLQRLVLDFPYIFFCNFSRAFLTAKCIDSVLGLLAHARPCNALTFFNRILWREALVYNSFFFFGISVIRKLFDIRFSYKHCNFLAFAHSSRWHRRPWSPSKNLEFEQHCHNACAYCIEFRIVRIEQKRKCQAYRSKLF